MLIYSGQFSSKLDAFRAIMDKNFNNMLDLSEFKPDINLGAKRLYEAMHYIMQGGKSLRPYLFTKIIEMQVNVDDSVDEIKDFMDLALSIELIHVYSLVHDDLPAMDNDDYRRGQLTVHKKFDEATAILTGNTLLTKAFQIITEHKKLKDSLKVRIIQYVTEKIGCFGLMGGQMMDICFEKLIANKEQVLEMYRLKSSSMFQIACVMAAIAMDLSENYINNLDLFANKLGIAFQIADDLLDVEGDYKTVGKSINKDVALNKSNIIAVLGIQESKDILQKITQEAIDYLQIFGDKAIDLIEIVQFNLIRDK